MNILRFVKKKELINKADDYLLKIAVNELELYHKRLSDMLDDHNCRANRAKAKELVTKNEC